MKRFLEKHINWNNEKNILLKESREISFESVWQALEEWNIFEIIKHTNSEKYPNQKILHIDINDYIYIVPFIENDNEIFLKTMIPSRKETKKLLLNNYKNND